MSKYFLLSKAHKAKQEKVFIRFIFHLPFSSPDFYIYLFAEILFYNPFMVDFHVKNHNVIDKLDKLNNHTLNCFAHIHYKQKKVHVEIFVV